MGLNCGASCIRYILFTFNIIFFIGGAAVLGVGTWVQADLDSFRKFLSQVYPAGESVVTGDNFTTEIIAHIHKIGYVLLGIGSFIVLVAFMGCYGAYKELRPLLVGYTVCLIIIMCAQIGVGIAVGPYKSDLVGSIESRLKQELISKYEFVDHIPRIDKITPTNRSSSFIAETDIVNNLQLALSCCGLRSYEDFRESPYGRMENVFQAPVFCCKLSDIPTRTVEDNNCLEIRNDTNSNQNEGCLRKIEKFIEENSAIVSAVSVGIFSIELVGIFFGFCLCCFIGDKARKARRID